MSPTGIGENTERVVAAAVTYEGLTFSMPPPARHHSIIHKVVECVRVVDAYREHCEQGFLTSLGRYVSREEACRIARMAGQLDARTKTGPASALFSEDLW